MLKTLRISFALKNTYRVNGILHALKQIPLLKRVLPDRLYQVRGLKIFANILSVLWEIVSIFLGKFLYFLTMVCGVGLLYERAPAGLGFLHILLFLTLIGSYMNTSLFNPTLDKYYAMILLRMNARSYTLVNYGYALGKVVVGFLPFTILFGLDRGVPLWLCLLIPVCIAGVKVAVAADSLRDYEMHGYVRNENNLQKIAWLLTRRPMRRTSPPTRPSPAKKRALSSSTTCSSSGTGRFCGNPPCASPMSACFSAAARCCSW